MAEIPRFVADRMLTRLARWLRLMGADVLSEPDLHGPAMLARARAEDRIVLTRDKRLRLAAEVLFIESNFFREQLVQVLRRFPFDPRPHAFTRCSQCNEPLKRLGRDVVRGRVPPFVYASQESFALCERCGRVYWEATHLKRALAELQAMGLWDTAS
jgi:uncharacterized protein